ncbi:cbb3-type cytochrome oxidase subunit 3 [Lysobacter sp. TAF61]|uniref:cbb3-type cytochrome oxidase subunit 3 n=1 Tax=Lysobacter sp. TAF61 TaxID=3233072 RepID=UPI003F955700
MVSGIITALLLVLFVGGWIWVWSPRRKSEFDAAAQLPLDEWGVDAKKEKRS